MIEEPMSSRDRRYKAIRYTVRLEITVKAYLKYITGAVTLCAAHNIPLCVACYNFAVRFTVLLV